MIKMTHYGVTSALGSPGYIPVHVIQGLSIQPEIQPPLPFLRSYFNYINTSSCVALCTGVHRLAQALQTGTFSMPVDTPSIYFRCDLVAGRDTICKEVIDAFKAGPDRFPIPQSDLIEEIGLGRSVSCGYCCC